MQYIIIQSIYQICNQCNRFLDGQLNQILMITRSHAIYSESCNIRKGLLNNTILHYTTLHYTEWAWVIVNCYRRILYIEIHLSISRSEIRISFYLILSIYLAFWGKLRKVKFLSKESNTNESKQVLVRVRTILSWRGIVLTVTARVRMSLC